MANPEHVEVFNKGAEPIAEWRRSHPGSYPDLSDANLRGANLRGADLTGSRLFDADLSDADLAGANLTEAKLTRANLNEANLTEANLSRADLKWARLSRANLTEARLSEANLSGAKLTEAILTQADVSWACLIVTNLIAANLTAANLTLANLTEADLTEANLTQADLTFASVNRTNIRGARFDRAIHRGTAFSDVNLSETAGLDSVNHGAPCSIGIDTIFKSRGKIPESFLRGCGVPDELIVQLPAIIGSMEPIQFYSCFISYSHKDEEFTKRLHERMGRDKLKVWYAPKDIRGGKKTHEQIDQAIRVYDKLLLVLSEHSMDSEWVKSEIRWARQKERDTGKRVLFPIRLVDMDTIKKWTCFDADGGKDLAIEVREYHIPDFRNWKDHESFEAEYAKLLRDLKKDEEIK